LNLRFFFKRKIILLNITEIREQEPKRENFNHLKEQISYESFFFFSQKQYKYFKRFCNKWSLQLKLLSNGKAVGYGVLLLHFIIASVSKMLVAVITIAIIVTVSTFYWALNFITNRFDIKLIKSFSSIFWTLTNW
jgi:hypothetical protein